MWLRMEWEDNFYKEKWVSSMKKCQMNHGWAFLNKRFDQVENTIVAFCDRCGYRDEKALRLQKKIDKANKEYDTYKRITIDKVIALPEELI